MIEILSEFPAIARKFREARVSAVSAARNLFRAVA
jgi:hypothetical protein